LSTTGRDEGGGEGGREKKEREIEREREREREGREIEVLKVFRTGVKTKKLRSISSTFLREDFMCADPTSAKRQSSYQCCFAL